MAERKYPPKLTNYNMTLDNFQEMRSALPAYDDPVRHPIAAYDEPTYPPVAANTTLTNTTSKGTDLSGQRVVVVLGPTGAGKSSLIKDLSGDRRITVGHGLNSGTVS